MNRPSQKSILAGVVRKREANNKTNEANDTNDANSLSAPKIPKRSISPIEANGKQVTAGDTNPNATATATAVAGDLNKGAFKCIGILPGIGKYKESSDSEKSTDTDDEYDFSDYDWIGRKIKKSCKDDDC